MRLISPGVLAATRARAHHHHHHHWDRCLARPAHLSSRRPPAGGSTRSPAPFLQASPPGSSPIRFVRYNSKSPETLTQIRGSCWLHDRFRSAGGQTDRGTDARTHTPAVPCALRPPLAPVCRCARAWGRVSGYRYVGHTPWLGPRTRGQSRGAAVDRGPRPSGGWLIFRSWQILKSYALDIHELLHENRI